MQSRTKQHLITFTVNHLATNPLWVDLEFKNQSMEVFNLVADGLVFLF